MFGGGRRPILNPGRRGLLSAACINDSGVGLTRLRVVVLVHSQVAPRWLSELVRELAATPFLEVAVVEARPAARKTHRSLFRAYERIDHLLFASEPYALHRTLIPFISRVF